MTHTTSSPDRPTNDEFLSGYFVVALSNAAERAVDDIYHDRQRSVAIFKRLWKLMERELARSGACARQLCLEGGISRMLISGYAPETVIREMLCRHNVYTEDLSDLEIAGQSPRFRARMRDFQRANREDGGERLRQRLMQGVPGNSEYRVLYPPLFGERGRPISISIAEVVAIDRVRGRNHQ